MSKIKLLSSPKSSKSKLEDPTSSAPPVAPETSPPQPTNDDIIQHRGEGFFLHCPRPDDHTHGRDDLIPLPSSETILHSPVDIAEQNFQSQYSQTDAEKWILHGTRHFASRRYQAFKSYTGIACCVAALGMLRRLRARAWNEDTVDETLDVGFNLFRESLIERGGPIRSLVLGELKDTFNIRDKIYRHRESGVSVWGKLVSNDPKVFNLCRGIEFLFKEADSGILQIPGEYETAIWDEGGKYYLYHPWPADEHGRRVGLQGGGKACIMYFKHISQLCETFMENVTELKRKPFSIAGVGVFDS